MFLSLVASVCIAKADDIDREEFLIYQVVFEQEYIAKLGFIDLKSRRGRKFGEQEPPLVPRSVLIIDQTITGPEGHFGRPWDDTLRILQEKFPTFTSQVMHAWQSRNEKPHTIADRFSFSVGHRLLSKAEIDEAFLPSKWWDSFYQHFPDALGYFKLSRVGFDAGRQNAVVYIENSQDGKWGSGYFWILSNEHGAWVIRGNINVWIS